MKSSTNCPLTILFFPRENKKVAVLALLLRIKREKKEGQRREVQARYGQPTGLYASIFEQSRSWRDAVLVFFSCPLKALKHSQT